MKDLKLTDRVVVEVHGEECTLEQMAASLRAVAEMIEQCRKGGEFPIGNKGDLLWEHECTDYGFRMGDKSLIAMHYYGSEPKPRVISDELQRKVVEWLKMVYEQDDYELKYTDGDLVDAAIDIMAEIAKGGES